jgi:hypothetical protein
VVFNVGRQSGVRRGNHKTHSKCSIDVLGKDNTQIVVGHCPWCAVLGAVAEVWVPGIADVDCGIERGFAPTRKLTVNQFVAIGIYEIVEERRLVGEKAVIEPSDARHLMDAADFQSVVHHTIAVDLIDNVFGR